MNAKTMCAAGAALAVMLAAGTATAAPASSCQLIRGDPRGPDAVHVVAVSEAGSPLTARSFCRAFNSGFHGRRWRGVYGQVRCAFQADGAALTFAVTTENALAGRLVCGSLTASFRGLFQRIM